MICAADLHLRRTRPRCRKDDYLAAQERKFRFILGQALGSPPLVVAGDFFHTPRPGEAMLRWVIDLLREYDVRPVVVPGQHDMPGHSLDNIGDSGLGVLASAGVIDLMTLQDDFRQWFTYSIYGYPYGTVPNISGSLGDHPEGSRVALWHHMAINEPLWPGQVADKSHSLLRKYPQFNLLVTGDNHQGFAIAETDALVKSPKTRQLYRGYRWLVNPGSMMRMTAIQAGYEPSVYRFEDGGVDRLALPIEDDVFDLGELERSKENHARVQAFLDGLDERWEVDFNFEKSLVDYLGANPVDAETEALLWRCVAVAFSVPAEGAK